MLLLMLCYRFGCFESAALLHLSSDSLHEAAETACDAAANPSGFIEDAAGAAAPAGGPWTDEAWALEWQERGAPSEGSLVDFLAQDLAASIGTTFGCTDTSSAKVASRLLFAGVPTPGANEELRWGPRSHVKLVLLSAIDRGLAGSDPLAKIVALSVRLLPPSSPFVAASVVVLLFFFSSSRRQGHMGIANLLRRSFVGSCCCASCAAAAAFLVSSAAPSCSS